ncbi:Hypothetical predicted protein, partial [Marmota monax]
ERVQTSSTTDLPTRATYGFTQLPLLSRARACEREERSSQQLWTTGALASRRK